MTTTIDGTYITFNSTNTQSEAVQTTFGSIGSYTVAYYNPTGGVYTVSGGSTTAGSNLYYATQAKTLGVYYASSANYYMSAYVAGPVTVSTLGLSGTWRCMVSSAKSATATTPQFWVRIS